MDARPSFPTREHEIAAHEIVEYFRHNKVVKAVILTGSCAHGGATKDSCLDISILLSEKDFDSKMAVIRNKWSKFYESHKVFNELESVGEFSEVHITYTDGNFEPKPRDWTSGPDDFELEIGNTVAYGVPLWASGDRFEELRSLWLPYYNDELRKERIDMVKKFCFNNLFHIPLYVERGLYFQSFKRFYDAQREFIQGLFISKRKYPIAYDKWIRKQFHEILKETELYNEITKLMEIKNFESDELIEKSKHLKQLFDDNVTF